MVHMTTIIPRWDEVHFFETIDPTEPFMDLWKRKRIL